MLTPFQGIVRLIVPMMMWVLFLPVIQISAQTSTQPNLKVAITADTDDDPMRWRVLLRDLIVAQENVDLLLIMGDYDYTGIPTDVEAYFSHVNHTLGNTDTHIQVPVFGASTKNHGTWDAYYSYFQSYLDTTKYATPSDLVVHDGIADATDDQYAITYKGLKMVFIGHDDIDKGDYIRAHFGEDDHIFKVCGWHENGVRISENGRSLTQIENKPDKIGTDVYEACREHGAFIINGNSHVYSRMRTVTQYITDTISIDPAIPMNQIELAPGKNFTVVSGMGGKSHRDYHCEIHDHLLEHWATIYAKNFYMKSGVQIGDKNCNNQRASAVNHTMAVLFMTFNPNQPNKALARAIAYSHNADGSFSQEIIDEFEVLSPVEIPATPTPPPTPTSTQTPALDNTTPTVTPTPTDVAVPTNTAIPTTIPTPGTSTAPIYISSSDNGTVGSINYSDEDILSFDGSYISIVFDGSAAGVTKDVNGFALLNDDSILLTFDQAFDVPGLGIVDDSDIVRFVPSKATIATNPTSANSVGTFEWFVDGDDVGLATRGEDIDAIGITPDGRLVISTLGNYDVNGISGTDEDLLIFNALQFGETTVGTWDLYVQGSNVSLAREDIGGVWIDPANDSILISVYNAFDVPNRQGGHSDIVAFHPSIYGMATAGLFGADLIWKGNSNGFTQRLDGIDLGAYNLPIGISGSIADLTLSHRDDVDPVIVGDNITYQLEVVNEGPDAAQDVILTDSLPYSVSFITATFSSGTCTEISNEVACSLGAMSNKERIEVTVTVSADVTGTVLNMTKVDASTLDPNHFNNIDDEVTEIHQEVPLPRNQSLLISSDTGGSVDGLNFADEDTLLYNLDNDTWTMLIDGGDLGIHGDLNGLTLLDDGTFLFTVDRTENLLGLGQVLETDVIRFEPNTLGWNTTGSITLFFRGSDHGLDTSNEDIDAIAVDGAGNLILSSAGAYNVPGFSGDDEDLLYFDFATNTWSLYLDGLQADLARVGKDIYAVWTNSSTSDIYFTTRSPFAIDNYMSDGNDLFICAPNVVGGATACTFRHFWDGDNHGIGRERIDAIYVGNALSLITAVILTDQTEQDKFEPVIETNDDLNDGMEEEIDEDDDEEVEEEDGRAIDPVMSKTLFLPIITK